MLELQKAIGVESDAFVAGNTQKDLTELTSELEKIVEGQKDFAGKLAQIKDTIDSVTILTNRNSLDVQQELTDIVQLSGTQTDSQIEASTSMDITTLL